MGSKTGETFGRAGGLSAWGICLMFLVLLAACKEETPPAPPPPRVTVAQPVQKAVTDFLDLTGNTQAIQTVQLRARVAGYLDKVFFQDGQRVKKDQLLFLIEQDTYQAQLRQAEGQISAQKALLEHAEIELVRYSNLLKHKAAAQTDVDNWRYQRDAAQANLKTARAGRDLAELNLGYTEIRAPFDGRIDRRLQDPGNLVGSGENTVLAEINQIDPIYVYFNINDSDLARLIKITKGIPGQDTGKKWPVSVGLANEEGYPHRGHLDFAAISLTPNTGTLLMRGIFPNPAGKVLPGLYARVRVPVETKIAFLVPAVALGGDQQGSYVLIVNENNGVERRSVKTGTSVDNLRVIEEGLKGEERVIVKGLLRAIPGRQVTPEPLPEQEGKNQPPASNSPQSPAREKKKP